MPRARRIPDAEWEVWREKLVRLYVEEGALLKDIIGIMARDDNFAITETQLKHRFGKWDVKKNIIDDDMTTILALKRKGQAMGKDIRFQYKGHDVEQERIERAHKRQKRELLSPTFIPSYIRVYVSRHQSPQDPTNVFASSHNAGIDTSPMRSARAPSFGAYDRVQPAINTDPVAALSLGMNRALYQVSHSADASHIYDNVVMTEAPDIPMIDLVEPDTSRDILQTPGLNDPHLDIGMTEHPNISARQPVARTWIQDSSSPLESDWQDFIAWPSSRRSSAGALSRPSSELYRKASHSDGSLSPGGVSQRLPPREIMDPLGSDVLERYATPQSVKGVQGISRVIADGIDSDSIMLPLQLLKSYLSAFLDCPQGHCVPNSSSSASEVILFEMLRSSWLWPKLDDVLEWSYKASTQAIQERRDHKAKEITLTSPPSTFTSQSRNGTLSRRGGSDARVKTHAHIICEGPQGQLRITFGTPIGPARDEDVSNPLHVLTLSFLPTGPKSTTALNIVFSKSPTLQCSSISPYIKSFNVVPQDSEIIEAVERNDLKAVQQLFDMNKASPLDVNPSGFSLLSYATRAKGLDVFRLLLQGGASTQNCVIYGNMLDIIWTTWKSFVDQNAGAFADWMRTVYDFEHCVSITDAALAYGCNIEDTTPYNFNLPNALFEICTAWPLGQLDPSCIEKVIQYLIKAGYDLEQSDETGLTPLLSAAGCYFPQVIRCLSTFVKVGANLHAVDLDRRGALFQALGPPQEFNDWSGSLVPYWARYGCNTLMWKHFLAWRYETEDELYAADYSDAVGDRVGDVEAELVAAEDEDSNLFWLAKHPMSVLKKRTRFKLLTLLKAGCDPNALDYDDLSPSDEARECGLWDEWTWALWKAGYVYDESDECWVQGHDEMNLAG